MPDTYGAGTQPVYRYYVAWTISGDLALEISLTGVSWSRQIRRAGQFSGKYVIDDDQSLEDAWTYTLPGRMSLYVTRNGKPVWGGLITGRAYDAATRELQLTAVGFESYLYRRTVWHDVSFSNTLDQYEVVRQLITLMETDFLGVAVAADQATPHPDNSSIGLRVEGRNSGKTQDKLTVYGYQLKSFGEVIEEYSNNLNGFEYNIELDLDRNKNQFTKTLVFRDTPPSQTPIGVTFTGDRPGIDDNFFEFPGNVLTISYEDSVDDAATRYFVVGKQPDPIGSVELPAPRGVMENEPYFSTEWPVFDLVESSDHTEVSLQSTLDAYAAVYGRQQRPPVPNWSVVVNGQMNPDVGSYSPGDWCRLVISDPFMRQSVEATGQLTRVVSKRIAEFSVSVPDTNQLPEAVTMTLIDEWVDGGS